jgi:hypothetical protein
MGNQASSGEDDLLLYRAAKSGDLANVKELLSISKSKKNYVTGYTDKVS